MPSRLRAALAEQLDVAEVDAEERLEVAAAVLDEVVGVRGRLRGDVDSRRRKDEHAVVAQDTCHVREECASVGQVLERLERADDVEAAVAEAQRLEIVHEELHVRPGVSRACIGDRVLAEVDSDHLSGLGGEERTAVTDTTGRVEHPLACAERQREPITLLVDRERPRGGFVRNDALGVGHGETVSWAVVGVIRRLPLDAAAAVLIPVTVVLFAFGSSSAQELLRIGGPGRWIALLALAAVALSRLALLSPRPRSLPAAWLAAAAFVAVGVDSAFWSVDPRLTLSRMFTVGVLFVAAGALALGADDARAAASRVLIGVLGGIAAVAVISIVVLLVSHDDAVLAATGGAGWRFRGVGNNPNTVPMLLCIGLPLAVWQAFERGRRARSLGVALTLLFAGEIAFSGTRGALIAGFGGALATALFVAPSTRHRVAAVAALVALGLVSIALAKIPSPAAAFTTGKPAQAIVPTKGIDAQLVFRLEDEIGSSPAGGYEPPVHRTFLGSSGRVQAWDGALHQGAKRPLAGYGFGTENKVFVDRFSSFEGSFVENSYIGLFLQLGLAGVAAFFALLGALAWSAALVVRSSPPAAAATGVLVAACLIGMTQSGLFSVGNIAAASIWICVLTLPVLARERAA